MVLEAFATTLDIIVLFIQPLHFELDQLIFQLIELDLGVDSIDFVSKFSHSSLDLLDIVLYFGCDSQEGLFLCFILILNSLKFLKSLLLLFQSWS